MRVSKDVTYQNLIQKYFSGFFKMKVLVVFVVKYQKFHTRKTKGYYNSQGMFYLFKAKWVIKL